MTPSQSIALCIKRCARDRDGRGPWQATASCAKSLGGSRNDARAANAARRIGEWLRGWKA